MLACSSNLAFSHGEVLEDKWSAVVVHSHYVSPRCGFAEINPIPKGQGLPSGALQQAVDDLADSLGCPNYLVNSRQFRDGESLPESRGGAKFHS